MPKQFTSHPNIFKAAILILFVFTSCHNGNIKLDVTRQSSDLMECNKIFGNSIKKIEEENEMLIQTGTYYGSDDSEDRQAAIVVINHTPKVFYLTSQVTISGETTEVYQGDEYSLSLRYTERRDGNRILYTGSCRVRNKLSMSEYALEGQPNIHNY